MNPVEQGSGSDAPGGLIPGRRQGGLVTLLFTDLVGSTALKQSLGDYAGVALVQEHHALVREILKQFPQGEEISTAGDSFFLLFVKPSDAVRFALLLQSRLRKFNAGRAVPLQDRVGLHLGEVVIEDIGRGRRDLHGIQVDTCARVMSLAHAGQILMTRPVFDNARQSLKGEEIEGAGSLSWLNHGRFELKGIDEPVEICEVRAPDSGGLSQPKTSEKARRVETPDEESVLGWRPAVGQVVPHTQWLLEKKLGEGGFGEVWLGQHHKLKERRVFKFCFRADRVRSLKREMTLFRIIKERIGDHPNIVRLLEVNFEEPPFYVVMDHVQGQDLKTWCEQQGGAEKVPLETKLEIVAQIADALQAAHDAGIIHRDVKPANILVSEVGATGSKPTAKLTDFGIGQVVSAEALVGVTGTGFTQTIVGSESSSQTGTQLYMAPELLAGKPASTRSDTYSLGVVLYQLLVGDFSRPVTTDWHREITDPLLRDDLKLCFAGDPQERFAGPGVLAKNLRALPERRATLNRQQVEMAAREREAYRRGVMRTVGISAVLLMVFAGLAVLAWKQSRAAVATARVLRVNSYAADMRVVQASLEEENRGRALELLKRYAPGGANPLGTGKEDLRGLEWRYLWTLAQGEDVGTWMRFDGGAWDVVFSPARNGLLAGLGRDGSIKVMETATRRKVIELKSVSPVENAAVHSLAFAPDGKAFVALQGNKITVWETERWTVVTNLVPGEPASSPLSLAYSPDGKTLAACVEGGVRLWETRSWGQQFLATGLKSTAWPSLAISANGTWLAAAGFELSSVQLWDLESRRQVGSLEDSGGTLVCLAFSPKEDLLAAGDWYGNVRVWDAAGRKQLWTLETRASVLNGISFSPDGQTLALAGCDHTIRLVDAATGKARTTLRGHLKETWKVVFAPDGSNMASASKDGTIRLWPAVPATNAADSWTPSPGEWVDKFECEPAMVATRSTNHVYQFWALKNGVTGPVLSLNLGLDPAGYCMSTDGGLVAVGRTNGTIELYDGSAARLVRTLTVANKDEAVIPRAISSDKKLLVLGQGSVLSGRDLESGKQVFMLPDSEDKFWYVHPVSFSPDGTLLAYVGHKHTIRIWNVLRRARAATLEGHSEGIHCVNFSPDGTRVLSAGLDNEVRIWDVATGRLTGQPLRGHKQSLLYGQFSPDGKTALSWDLSSVRLWNVLSGQEVISLRNEQTLLLSRDGKTLAFPTPNGGLRLVRLPTLAEIDVLEQSRHNLLQEE